MIRMIKLKSTLKKYWIDLLIILFFALIGMKALSHPGLFTAHDIWHQVARIYYYYQGVTDGQFPPYWISNLASGLGYPLFFFSYHLPWLFSLPFLKAGFDIPSTLKILFFLSFFLSGIFMYLFSRALLKRRLAALLSSIIYLWSPYHFLIVFVGASMGIAFIFTFLPLLLLGIHTIAEQKKFGVAILALSTSAIILSHIMHLVFIAPLITVFIFWEIINLRKRGQILNFIKKLSIGFLLALLISSFYLIPATYYRPYTKVQQEAGITQLFERNFVDFKQLVYSKWGFGPIVTSAKEGAISFQLGISQWLSILGVISLLVLGKVLKKYQLLSLTLLTAFAISVFLMLDISQFIWKIIIKSITIDFPFRFLLPASFIGSIMAGILLTILKTRLQLFFSLSLIFLTLYSNRNHINVNLYTDIPTSSYLASEMTTNTFNEYLPIQADSRLLNQKYHAFEGNNIFVNDLKRDTKSIALSVDASTATNISLGQFYFPGQTLYLNGEKIFYQKDPQGRINFDLPSGKHRIFLQFEETNIIKFSKILSLVGLLWLIFLFLDLGKKRASNKTKLM